MSIATRHGLYVFNGDRPDTAPARATQIDGIIGGVGIVIADGTISRIREIQIKAASLRNDEVPKNEQLSLIDKAAPILKSVIATFNRALHNNDKALLVFYGHFFQEFSMLPIRKNDGDPYVIYQNYLAKNPSKSLIMALDPSKPFEDQFPMHMLEHLEKWDAFLAQPVIAKDLFPVTIRWGRHEPTGSPNPQPRG